MINNRKGYTLVELMLVIALIGIVTTVAYSIFFTGQKSFEVGIDKGSGQADERILREHLAKELRYIKKVYDEFPIKGTTSIYYSLEIKSIDGKHQLVKKTYLNDKEEPGEQKIPVYFDKLIIQNSGGKINIEFTPIKSDPEYDITTSEYKFTIGLENVGDLGDAILLTYWKNKKEKNKSKIYYAYPQDIIISD